jgi:gliding motility-associated-like protein
MSKKLRSLLFVTLFPLFALATHIVGGSLTYEHLGGSTYRIVLKLYRDCAVGNAAFPGNVGIRITQPNGTLIQTVTIPFPGATNVQPQIDSCAVDPGICLQEAIYSAVVNNLPPNPGGYHVYYQYCCRNASLQNVVAPLSTGESWYTYIPDNSIWLTNSSPVWTNFPPVFVCQGNPLNFDHSATDIDGDSLVYSLYTPHNNNAPTFPGNVCTFTPITWVGGYGPTNALGGPPNSLTISNTGLLNDNPPQIGQFVVGIRCEEWRNGQKIGEILRDFQFNVVYCPPLAQPGFTALGNCSGSTVQFTNTTSPPATSYSWDFGDPMSVNDTSTQVNPPAWTYSGLGPYYVTLIVNYGTPCADTIMDTIAIAWTNASFTHNAPVCAGTSVQFTDNSTVSLNNNVTGWSWTFGDLTSSTLQNPTHPYSGGGNYTVTLYTFSSAGCTDTSVQTIYIQPRPISNAGLDTIACLNNPTVPLGGTVLNATGGMWIGAGVFNPNNTTLNATYTPTPQEVTNGSATLLLISTGNGLCAADTDTIVITFYPGPTADAGPDTIYVCRDTGYINLNGVVTVATGGQWNAINGTGTFNPNNTSLNTSYIPSNADTAQGFVTIVLTTTGNGNCLLSSDTLTIYFTAPPTVSILASDTACSGDWIQLNVNTSTGAGVWTTLGDGTFNPSNTILNPTYIPGTNDANLGFVQLIFSSGNNGGCQIQRDTFLIRLIPSPTAQFTSVSACPNDTVQFTDTSVPNVGSITTWNWNFGDSNISTLQNPSHVYTAPGPYVVTLVVTSTNGCRDTIVDTVNVYYPPVVDFGYIGGCQNEAVMFYDSTFVNGGTPVSWSWNFGDNSTGNTTQNPSHSYASGGNYGVTLTVISNQGCVGTATLPVTIFATPLANFNADDYTAVIGQNISFTDLSSPVVSWQWYFGDGDSSFVQNPTHTYGAGGIYTVILVVTDSNGCVDTIYKEVVVSMPPDVPSGFSPNGDGVNDIVFVYGGPYKKLEFRIYNNWGELIFTSTRQNLGWDGTRDGKLQPIGVYVWTLQATTEDDVAHELSGDVTLMR